MEQSISVECVSLQFVKWYMFLLFSSILQAQPLPVSVATVFHHEIEQPVKPAPISSSWSWTAAECLRRGRSHLPVSTDRNRWSWTARATAIVLRCIRRRWVLLPVHALPEVMGPRSVSTNLTATTVRTHRMRAMAFPRSLSESLLDPLLFVLIEPNRVINKTTSPISSAILSHLSSGCSIPEENSEEYINNYGKVPLRSHTQHRSMDEFVNNVSIRPSNFKG